MDQNDILAGQKYRNIKNNTLSRMNNNNSSRLDKSEIIPGSYQLPEILKP